MGVLSDRKEEGGARRIGASRFALPRKHVVVGTAGPGLRVSGRQSKGPRDATRARVAGAKRVCLALSLRLRLHRTRRVRRGFGFSGAGCRGANRTLVQPQGIIPLNGAALAPQISRSPSKNETGVERRELKDLQTSRPAARKS